MIVEPSVDPLSALSLAGNIVQFVDFGSRVLLDSWEIYKSSTGTLKANDQLELVATDLKALIIKFQRPISSSSVHGCFTGDQQEIQNSLSKICDEATKIAIDLVDRLHSLKVKDDNRVLGSIQQSFKSVWSRDEIMGLMKRLTSLREALDSHVLFSLREQLVTFSVGVSDRFDSLDQQSQQIIDGLLSGGDYKCSILQEVREQTIAVTQLVSRLEMFNQNEHLKTRAMVIKAIHQCRESVNEDCDNNMARGNSEVSGELPKVTANMELLEVSPDDELKLRLSVDTYVLESLRYPTMTNRYEKVDEAYPDTFDWIFHDSMDAKNKWSNFKEWLSSGTGMYWVNGKAGSGKSTLMRFIFDDPRTRQYLSSWAQQRPVSIATFFFWNSGTREQRSEIGLLRALLFEILHQHPSLIAVALPWVWARAYSRYISGLPVVANESWSVSKLTKALKTLTTQKDNNLQLCLFIDGLDEFEGDHDHLAQFFKEIATSENIKICLSSRPWVVFQDHFERFPSLRLQDLTEKDIEHFVRGSFKGNTAFQLLAEKETGQSTALIKELVDRADGVFLWVRIVVRSMVRGFTNHDEIPDLLKRLRLFPRELKPLYQHLLSLIEPIYLEWASKAFQIVRAARIHRDHLGHKDHITLPLTIFDFYLAMRDDDASKTVQNVPASEAETFWKDKSSTRLSCYYSMMEDFLAKRKETQIKLTVRCAGLLEAWDRGATENVQYLHRTARDYIEGTKVWSVILNFTDKTAFDANAAMMRSSILRLQVALSNTTRMSLVDHETAVSAMIYAYCSSRKLRSVNVELIDNLEQMLIRTTPGDSLGPSKRPLATALTYSEDLTFMQFAVLYSLTPYIRAKIAHFNRTQRLKASHSRIGLLHYALRHRESENGNRYPLPDLELVAMLLRNGESPNAVHQGSTPWENALSYVYHSSWDNPQEAEDKLQYVQILHLLLKAGANVLARVQCDGENLSAADIISMKLSGTFPLETADLLKELNSRSDRGKANSRKSIGTWFRKINT